ncbi:MAG: porin family protein, partial [Sphingobium sp.]
MKTVIFAATAAAVLSISAPALAQDYAPFTGLRAEAIVGYDKLDTNNGIIGNPDGLLYGAALGYDIQAGNIVLGIEGEITDSTGKADFGAFDVDVARDLYVGGRVGVAMGSRSLIYAKAGYTNARISTDGAGGDNGDGVRVGAGLEQQLGGQLFLKGEYRYSNYEGDVERHQVV